MDGLIAYILSKKYATAYADEVGRRVEQAGFKVQIESDRSILEGVGKPKIMYFLPKEDPKQGDGYDEFIYEDNKWEWVGKTDVDLSNYMTLASINPTVQEIEDMPSGQIYNEANDGVVTIKGGTELLGVLNKGVNPEYGGKGKIGQISYYSGKMYQCFGLNSQGTKYVWKLISFAEADVIRAQFSPGGSKEFVISSSTTLQGIWELFTKYHCVKVVLTGYFGADTGQVCWITNVEGANHEKLSAFMLPTAGSTDYRNRIHFLEQTADSSSDTLRLVTKYVYPPYEEYYTKSEIDSMIGDIETALSEV